MVRFSLSGLPASANDSRLPWPGTEGAVAGPPRPTESDSQVTIRVSLRIGLLRSRSARKDHDGVTGSASRRPERMARATVGESHSTCFVTASAARMATGWLRRPGRRNQRTFA